MRGRLMLLLVLPGALILLWALFLRDNSPEQRVRALLERGREAFEAGNAGDCVAECAEDFVLDGRRRLTRAELRDGLASWFVAERGGLFGDLPWQLEIPPESLLIEPAGADGELRALFLARFWREPLGGAPRWEVELELELVPEGRSFLIRSARERRTVSGRSLLRW